MKPDEQVEPNVLLDHLRTSHANAQDVIKFIDTKTGVVTGLVSLALAFPFLLGQYFVGESFDSSRWQLLYESHPTLSISVFTAFSWSLTCGVVSIYCSLVSLMARPPSLWDKPIEIEKARFCILFPFHAAAHANHARAYYSKITGGLTNKELLGEYEYQLEQLGSIVERKIYWHRRAATLFVLQLILPATFMIPIWLTKKLLCVLTVLWLGACAVVKMVVVKLHRLSSSFRAWLRRGPK